MMQNNPLLTNFQTPYDTTPFDKIKPEHFAPAFKQKIEEAEKVFNQIIVNSEPPTLRNTLLPIEKKYDEINRLGLILFNLNSAETNSKIQAVTQKISPGLTKFMSKLMLNKKYFNRIKKLYQNIDKENYTGEERRLIETTFLNMKRNGANLTQEKKRTLTNIQMKLSKLTLKFNENVLEETNNFEYHTLDIADLDGLPINEIEAAAHFANSKNKEGWLITLQYPSYGPFMKYAHNRGLREKIYRAYTSRCNNDNDRDNKALISKITALRLKQAKILGYKNYSEFVLEERMAQTPKKVRSFLQELHLASKPFALKELTELCEFAKQKGHYDKLMPWDLLYYSEMQKTERFGFDENMIKPYFQLDSVINGVFGLANTLYGLKFQRVANIPVYHPDVITYEVYDTDGSFLAILYADFHPRESKQGGAWMTEYLSQSNINGENKRPHISICCNFTKPTAKQPSLLTFSEVNTFLHEFGHALHGMLANTVYPSLSGTNVYRDFVELPSQLMENWGTELEWLEKFAFHYETGEAIPKELVQKLIDARNFQAGYQSERQLTFGMLDMAWHMIEHPVKNNIIDFETDKTSATQLLPIVDGSCISTSFSHIFAGGYAAGYYGYKWAEVLDADAFSVFTENGIFNKEVAAKFRVEILEKGGTVHPSELYRNFKGKEPSIDALLERSGLKQ